MEHLTKNGEPWTTSLRLSNERQLNPPSLSNVGKILQDNMKPMFRELKIDVAACPSLIKEPYNLAGIGLCGNTSLIEIGGYTTFVSSPRYTARWDIQALLSCFCHDSFIIGAGYAAKPSMPYNGHLIMNAMYKAPANITNASRIVFTDASNGQRRIETLTDPKQMICSFMGNFFLSEGRPGNVIRIRAKGRESNLDIITIMQDILYKHFQVEKNCTIALGGVLRMKNGRVVQNVMSERYPPQVLSFSDLTRRFQRQNIEMNIRSDLIAVGTLVNIKPQLSVTQHYGLLLPLRRYQFYSFSDYGAGGQFINDTTKDMTEYEGYFNLVKKIYSVDYCE